MEVAPSVRHRGRMHYAWVIVVLGVLATAAAIGLARLTYSLMLPGMKDTLKLDYAQTGQIAAGDFVGYMLMALVGGALAARYSPRLIISVSSFVLAIFLFATGMAPNFWTALACRFMTGLGSGGLNVPMMGLMSAWFGARRRGTAVGIVVAGSSLGLIFSGEFLPKIMKGELLPGLMPPIAEGWRYGWFTLGTLVSAIAVLAAVFLRNRPEDKGLDPVGVTRGSAEHTSRADVRLRWSQLAKSAALWHLAILYMFFGFSYIVYVTFFASHLKDRGLSLEEAAAMWGWMGWLTLPSGLVWGWVSDALGRKYGLAIVYGLLGSASLVFALAGSPPGYFLSLVLFSAAGWSIPGIMTAAIGDYVPPNIAPAAFGMITLIFGIGQAVGPSIAGALRDSTGTFVVSFYFSGAVGLAGAVTALFLRRPKVWG